MTGSTQRTASGGESWFRLDETGDWHAQSQLLAATPHTSKAGARGLLCTSHRSIPEAGCVYGQDPCVDGGGQLNARRGGTMQHRQGACQRCQQRELASMPACAAHYARTPSHHQLDSETTCPEKARPKAGRRNATRAGSSAGRRLVPCTCDATPAQGWKDARKGPSGSRRRGFPPAVQAVREQVTHDPQSTGWQQALLVGQRKGGQEKKRAFSRIGRAMTTQKK